jgi:hypothetical protein
MIPPTNANAPPSPATRVCVAAPAELDEVLGEPDDEALLPEVSAAEVPAVEVLVEIVSAVEVVTVELLPAVGLPLVES